VSKRIPVISRRPVIARIPVTNSPWEPVQRAARERYRGALHKRDDSRLAFESFPSKLTAAQVRRAETEMEDAIAIAGEFQVSDLPWALP
jgi:hypothetical protein